MFVPGGWAVTHAVGKMAQGLGQGGDGLLGEQGSPEGGGNSPGAVFLSDVTHPEC